MQRGDHSALEQLVRRYLRRVHAVAAAFLAERADAEDAVQEAFVRAIAGIERYDPRRPFAPWLYQIARNAARSRRAAATRGRELPMPEREIPEGSADPLAALERAEVRSLVSDALDALPEQRRVAFRLHDVEGYETSEIAHLMGLSIGTVRSHVFHARRALRAVLGGKLVGWTTEERG